MKNKLLAAISLAIIASIFFFKASGAQTIVPMYFFWGNGCPHCAKEKIFLENLKNQNPNIVLYDFEVYQNQKNLNLLVEIGQRTGADVRGVPLLVVGNQVIIGYFDDYTTGEQIKEAVNVCLTEGCPDIVHPMVQSMSGISLPEPEQAPADVASEPSYNDDSSQNVDDNQDVILQDQIENAEQGVLDEDSNIFTDKPLSKLETKNELPKTIHLPLIGDVMTASVSLPVLTILLGALDGFNPCAMWTLIFLISLLLGMCDRRRMWILGFAFIIASSSVYFIFMSAWLNLILFLGFIFWIRLLIGLVALFGGAYNIKEYIYNKEGTCKVTNSSRRQKVFERLKTVTNNQSFWLALIGIIALAFVVNLVELICSAGLPAVYTQILALNNLPIWQYYLYLLLYIFFFMLDDLFVFVAAMYTLKMTGLSTKYARYSRLIGGILMVIIGLLMMFKPEWLMFG